MVYMGIMGHDGTRRTQTTDLADCTFTYGALMYDLSIMEKIWDHQTIPILTKYITYFLLLV